MSSPSQCPDAGNNPFRFSLHKLKSGRKVVTPRFLSASDMVKMVAGAPNSRLRQLVKRDISTTGAAALELREFLVGSEASGNEPCKWPEAASVSAGAPVDSETLDQRAERECRQRAEPAEEQRAANAKHGKHLLSDRSPFVCSVIAVGACMKGAFGPRSVDKKTPAQIEFLDWGYARGVDCKGAKLTARDAEHAMQMMGTAFGHEEYGCGLGNAGCSCPTLLKPSQPRTRCIWLPSPGNRKRFRAPELLEHWVFRSCFSGQKAQIAAKLATAVRNNGSTTVTDVAAAAVLYDGSAEDA